MSRTPDREVTASEARNYLEAWKAIHQMIAAGKSWSGRERNGCLLNTGDGKFANISAISGLDFADDARGAAVVDWDHDGDLDVWFTNRTSPQVRFMENTLSGGPHFLSLRLKGVASNRDAIGAKVEVELGDESASPTAARRIETVAAGTGFISQSSKWLHFGLGERRTISRVLVHWPGGKTQELRGLEPDRHYEVVQGQQSATPWRRPGSGSDFAANSNITFEPEEPIDFTRVARVALAERYPLRPNLAVIARGGERQTLTNSTGGPLLLTLFATWCAPCLEELTEFSNDADLLQEAGLSILALSIEEIEGRATRSDVATTLQRLDFPFDWGMATESLLETLQGIENDLFFMSQSLPLPMSYLLDRDGQIAVVYRGGVEVDQLLEDVAAVQSRDSSNVDVALFGGVWIARPRGYRADAHNQIGHYFAKGGDFAEAAISYERAARLRPNFAAFNNLGTALASQGQFDNAVRFFQRALELKPNSFQTHYNLGVILARQHQLEQSRRHFQKALEIQPDFEAARQRLQDLPPSTDQDR